MRFAPKKKAQVSAPIELFVAIIILAMSLALGLKVIGDVEEGKCVATLKTQTQQLKNAMIDVALGSAGTTRTVYFSLPTCGDKKIDGLQFALYLDPAYCRLCQGNYGYCWQVIPVSKDPTQANRHIQVSDSISCVNMAGDIQIKECAGGLPLSNAPCFEESGCNPLDFGVLKSVWDPSTPDSGPSRWKTLSGTDIRSFKIKLTKTTELAAGAERGAIEVCAEKG
ncbi:hypothetical protein J4220_00930 [Candidatus Micrarchaeota archaeon]|nr:hypothetical protein [Candidatus Micrarchaeota archaeon]